MLVNVEETKPHDCSRRPAIDEEGARELVRKFYICFRRTHERTNQSLPEYRPDFEHLCMSLPLYYIYFLETSFALQ